MDLIANVNNVEFSNVDLNKATKEIVKLSDTIKQNLYHVAYIISDVNERELFKEDGFNNVHEWTAKAFGFKKSFSYDLLKIGNEYTAPIKDSKTGKIKGYKSNLTPVAGKDFTVSQVKVMLPLGEWENVEEATLNNDITPDMTILEIKKKVKELKTPEKEEAEETEETPETETTEAPDEIEEIDFIKLIKVNGEYKIDIKNYPEIFGIGKNTKDIVTTIVNAWFENYAGLK